MCHRQGPATAETLAATSERLTEFLDAAAEDPAALPRNRKSRRRAATRSNHMHALSSLGYD